MNDAPLQLLDVHAGTPPPWWPLAPGWWLLAALLCAALAGWGWHVLRRRHRRAKMLRMFDAAIAGAPTPQAQVAAMSELLRRAARHVQPGAEALDGDAWLAALDAGLPAPVFGDGPGRLLLDGGYRREFAPAQVEALRVVARLRFASWMSPP